MNFLPSDYGTQINLLHSVLIGPLLAWTGYKLNTGKLLGNIEILALFVAGISVMGYHGIQSYNKQSNGLSVTQDYGFKINLMHLFFIGPLLAWTGWKLYKNKNVTDLEKTTLLFLGVASLLYHGYKTIQKYNHQHNN